MLPLLYGIYWIQHNYGKSDDLRPCLVVDILSEDKIKICLISSQIDLYDFGIMHCLLDAESPDFPQTGLGRTSYIDCKRIMVCHSSKLGNQMGILQGELLEDFKKFLGLDS